jgi:hypothetical protein
MTESPPRLLICMRVAEHTPRVPVRKRNGCCEICGAAVWISRTSPRTTLYRCMKCARDTLPPDVKVEPFTDCLQGKRCWRRT